MKKLTPEHFTALFILVFIIIGLIVFAIRPARGQSAICGPWQPDHPIYWLRCNWTETNARVDALEARIVQLEAALSEKVTREDAEAIAWAKAGDRITFWQGESAAYRDKWFYNQLYLRWRVHACRNAVPIQVQCPQ